MTARLPISGSDDGVWGGILNSFLEVSHNGDGTLQQNAITNAGGYVKPGTGIPAVDLSSSVQTSLNNANSAVQPGTAVSGDLSGTASAPTVTGTHLTSALPISQGGTGSATQNFVDISSNQTIGGTKTFSQPVASGGTILGAGTGWQATDSNLIAWTGEAVNSGTISGSGNMQLAAIPIRVATTVTNILYYVKTAGASLTSGGNFVGLYTSGGTLLSSSADMTTSWGATTGAYVTPLSSPQAVTPGIYYIAILWNGTTGPNIAYCQNISGALANLGVQNTPANYRAGVINSVGVAALPSSFTPSTMGQAGAIWHFAVN